MKNAKDVMLSVAQVCELEPGDENNATWINPGFTGVVREINERKTKAGKKFYPCLIADMTGPGTLEVSFFQRPPPFEVGDVIDIYGKGLRRTDFQGKAQASMSRDTQCDVMGKSAHELEQRARAEAGEPAVNGKAQLVNGQSVGCAMNQALETFRFIYTSVELKEMIKAPTFWAAVHEFASDQIRVARLLEKGNLAKPIRERCGLIKEVESGRSDPPASLTKPTPGPGGSVKLDSENEDVPY